MAAAGANARATWRWLRRQPANIEEALLAVNEITNNIERASEIIGRIRALVTKVPQRNESFEINEAIHEVIMLARAEMRKNDISVTTALAEGLHLIEGDRVQLQQVLLNLINNAMQAMSDVSVESRELVISTSMTEPNDIVVAVRDSGPGLHPANFERRGSWRSSVGEREHASGRYVSIHSTSTGWRRRRPCRGFRVRRIGAAAVSSKTVCSLSNRANQ
jgi:C4-dicarboxylate-specific signal transduction histidine kinase